MSKAREIIKLFEGVFLKNLTPTDPAKKFWIALTSELTQYDQKSKSSNPYSLAHYLGAVQDAEKMVKGSEDKKEILRALVSKFSYNRVKNKFGIAVVQNVATKYGLFG